ncbi:flagellar biosynthesis protein FlgI [Aestuariivita sp.]|jgi:hypothetical protein|uniref:flagellar biosynthesis protein FlgI n=1 Tax=Aestuariivita sp. TaxID=1872407 RepID=UPI00216CFE7F|nr:flagellar biosynthesis protein FlgI [Aestuariivita sp.]MCE8008986.1 flagellar biosynthesis protein FlgI [Aestuariivita sp.]
MTKRALRLGARMQARHRDLGTQVLTDEDRAHLDAYAEKLDAATALIREEIAAIGRGQLDAVGGFYAQKAETLKWLELRAPIVEPFLTHAMAKDCGLPEKLTAFKAALEEDSELLSRMAGVAATIAREIEKAINRTSLDGLYGKSGEKLSKSGKAQVRLDQEI